MISRVIRRLALPVLLGCGLPLALADTNDASQGMDSADAIENQAEMQGDMGNADDDAMHYWEQIGPDWERFRSQARDHWQAFTDEELERVKGRRDALVNMVRERYGRSQTDAERDVDGWASQVIGADTSNNQ